MLYKQTVPFPVSGPVSCQDCHGPAYIFKAASTAVAISAAITANRGGMSAYSSWTAAQISDVAAYVAVAAPPSLPPLAPTPASIASIDVFGSKLQFVTGARIGTTPATISNQNSDSLTLTPTSFIGVGAPQTVRLSVPGNPDFEAGVVNVQNNGALYLFGVEAAQVHSQQVSSAGLRLTPGKPFLLRAAVLATGSILSPAVQATVSRGGVPQGTVTLTGPAILQTSYDPYNNASMFSGVIPGAWVAPGMQITVSVATAPAMQMTFVPPIGAAAKLQMVLVPIQIGASVGVPPSATALQDALARIYPVARQDITVETRSPLVMTVKTPVTASEMFTINLRLETLRQSEAPGKVYYGVVPKSLLPTSGQFTAGLALAIPDLINPSTWLMSASGYDEPLGSAALDRFGLGWSLGAQTLLHELGHLHTRRHSPCAAGGLAVSGADPNFPYPDGKHGPEPLYSSTYADGAPGTIAEARLPANPPATVGLIPNDRLGDLMGYCYSTWFSSYNYAHVQQFLENRTALQTAASVQARATAMQSSTKPGDSRGFLVLSGQITERGLTMAPAQVLPSPAIAPHAGGPYTMAIRTKAGETISVAFSAPDVSHANAKSFTVVIPNPGPVESVEISKGLRTIPLANANNRAKAQSTMTAAKSTLSWAIEQDHVTVLWNAAAEPYLTLTMVRADGTRTVVASELTGGEVRVPVGSVPTGAYIELTLSNEVNARTVRVQ